MENETVELKENLHKDHRQRVFDRLEKDGLDSFYDYEIIELLLFYTIPRMDTNPIAHRLINEFGSLSNVLGADVKSLMKVPGVSKKSAVLLSTIPSVMRRYAVENLGKKAVLDSFEKAAEYVKALFAGERKENFYILCLDIKSRIICAEKIKEGSADELIINPRAAVMAATKHECTGVILAHNHPGGSAQPSMEDVSCTKRITLALTSIGIPVYDHIITATGDVFSFKREGLMSEVMSSVAVKIENAGRPYN